MFRISFIFNPFNSSLLTLVSDIDWQHLILFIPLQVPWANPLLFNQSRLRVFLLVLVRRKVIAMKGTLRRLRVVAVSLSRLRRMLLMTSYLVLSLVPLGIFHYTTQKSHWPGNKLRLVPVNHTLCQQWWCLPHPHLDRRVLHQSHRLILCATPFLFKPGRLIGFFLLLVRRIVIAAGSEYCLSPCPGFFVNNDDASLILI